MAGQFVRSPVSKMSIHQSDFAARAQAYPRLVTYVKSSAEQRLERPPWRFNGAADWVIGRWSRLEVKRNRGTRSQARRQGTRSSQSKGGARETERRGRNEGFGRADQALRSYKGAVNM